VRRLSFLVASMLALAPPCSARTISVAVDVSGSMASYGAWQHDALSAITAILSGGTVPAGRWRTAGSETAPKSFVFQSGDRILLIPFGDLQRADFPFFKDPVAIGRVAELEERFPLDAARFRDNRTNKTLAEVVAARLAANGERDASVIMVSDFLVDARLTAEQSQFLNETQSTYAVHVLSTLSWAGNQNVQIKLIRYTAEAPEPPAAPASKPASTSSLKVATQLINSPRALQVSWTTEGGVPATKYAVVIRNAKTSAVVFSKTNLATRSVTWNNPEAGSFAWTVSGDMQDGGRVTRSGMVAIADSGSGRLVFAIAALIALAAAGLWWADKANLLPRSMSRRRPEQRGIKA
jgi:hypothetical protein